MVAGPAPVPWAGSTQRSLGTPIRLPSAGSTQRSLGTLIRLPSAGSTQRSLGTLINKAPIAPTSSSPVGPWQLIVPLSLGAEVGTHSVI